MSTVIATEVTPQGLLIPRSALQEWLEQEIEVIKEQQRIIIQPKSAPRTERERVLQILEATGLLLPPESPLDHKPLSARQLDDLAQKFAAGRPLSEIIIEDRGRR
jgi:hypothetical protein